MDGPNLLQQALIGLGPRGRWTVPPGTVAAGGDAQHAAHRGDRMDSLLLLHERERRYGFGPVSLAKKAAATL